MTSTPASSLTSSSAAPATAAVLADPGIQPLGSVLLLDCTPLEITTASGLVLPVAVQPSDTRMEATLIARGPKCEREELTPGCRVFVGKYLSNEILRGERKYRLASEADILAVLQ